MRARRCGRFISIALIGALGSLSGLWASDFGLTIDSATSAAGGETVDVVQATSASAWLLLGSTEGLNFRLRATGALTHNGGSSLQWSIDRFRLGGEFAAPELPLSLFGFRLGRFSSADFSGEVLDHRLDGFEIVVYYPSAVVTATMGYTGFLFANSSRIVMSRADAVDSATGAVFAPPRLVGLLELEFPELVLRQTVTVSVSAQEDLRPLVEQGVFGPGLPESERLLVAESEQLFRPSRGGPVDTQYAGLGVSGPIGRAVYYRAFGVYGFGRVLLYRPDAESSTGYSYQFVPIQSYLAGGGVSLFAGRAFSSRLGTGFLIAGGDADFDGSGPVADGGGAYKAFIPVTSGARALVFSPGTSNVLTADLSYSARPFVAADSRALRNLQTMVRAIAFFQPTLGPVSAAGVNPAFAGESRYLGSELDAIVNFRPLSDLGMSLQIGVFFPTPVEGVFLADYGALRFLARFELSSSL